MSDQTTARADAQFLAALGEPTRLRIIELMLVEGEQSVGAVATALDVPMVNISHHLSLLKHAGILTDRKAGRHVIYELAEGANAKKRTLTNGRITVSLPASG